MRHDNDVLMISEFDDAETARAAIAAAETGHLVISSMRTSDPADTIDRIVSLFPEPQQRVVRGRLAAQLWRSSASVCSRATTRASRWLVRSSPTTTRKSGSLVAPMRRPSTS